jgi:hypothetical protein
MKPGEDQSANQKVLNSKPVNIIVWLVLPMYFTKIGTNGKAMLTSGAVQVDV